MRRGRKNIDPNGKMVSCSFSLTKQQKLMLEGMENPSKYLRDQLSISLSVNSRDELDLDIKKVKLEILTYETHLLSAKKRLMEFEDRQRGLDRMAEGAQDARIRLLADIKKQPHLNVLAWLQNRTDALKSCGFESAEDGEQWLKEHLVRPSR